MKTVQSVLFFIFCGTLMSSAQVPVLNSHPSARATIYLDFDGQYVSGTSWNWIGDIDAQPANISPSEVTEIFNRVAEDFRIFDLNITTDSTVFLAAPLSQRMRVIITPTSSWYGSAGGVSFIESFTWGDDTPAWVFSQLLSNNVKYIAEACSHETGHTLGLQHQSVYDAYCRKTAEYWSGQGSGEIGWAPIMGVGYYRNLTTWHLGKSSIGCNYLQNDIDRIISTNGFGLRVDDHAETIDQASTLAMEGYNFSANGIINSDADKDVFKIVLPANLNFRLLAYPESFGSANAGADVDVKVSLLNGTADTINRYNPDDLLNAGIDTVLQAGTYYLVVEGVGNVNLSDYGSLGHYMISGSLIIPLPVHHLKLKGKVINGLHMLNWEFQADEEIKEFEVQYSENGSSFKKLLAAGTSLLAVSYQPSNLNKVYYRVKAVTRLHGIGYYSNVVSLPPGPRNHAVRVLNSVVQDEIKVNSSADCQYQLMLTNGQLISEGKINKGYNQIPTPRNVKGLFLLRFLYANEFWTEKIVKQ
jgi:hypothetical protein